MSTVGSIGIDRYVFIKRTPSITNFSGRTNRKAVLSGSLQISSDLHNGYSSRKSDAS